MKNKGDTYWNPLELHNIEDPYPMYAILREKHPVYKAQSGEWVITRYDDVKNILRSKSFQTGNRLKWLNEGSEYLNKKGINIDALRNTFSSFLVFKNPPEHADLRNLLSNAWWDRNVDDIINANVNHLLSKLESPTFDFISDFAQPLPVITISKILGIPHEDHKRLKHLAKTVTEGLTLYVTLKELMKINAAAIEFTEFFKSELKKKLRSPDQSLISSIINENAKQETPLSDGELVSIFIFLFNAGEETTSNLIGSGLYNLLLHPEVLASLLSDRTLMNTAIDELLRYDASLQIAGRWCNDDYTIRQQQIKKGDTVSLVLGAANRDPKIFENPDDIILNRSPNKHLSFGNGIHYCMGDWLARKQASIAFNKLFDTFKKIEICKGTAQWNKVLTFRSLNQLKIKVSYS